MGGATVKLIEFLDPLCQKLLRLSDVLRQRNRRTKAVRLVRMRSGCGNRRADLLERATNPEHGRVAVASLGQLRYISLMNQVDVVVGNSSSGVLEAPSLNVPTVDIGDRQKGRERAGSVFHAAVERNAIATAISQALGRGRQPTISPYGDGESSRRFAEVVAAIPDFQKLLKKSFYDIAPTGTVS